MLAISLAGEKSKKLIFLYVVNNNLIKSCDPSMADELKDELKRMGRLLLRIACSRAIKEGVDAGFAIGYSPVQKAIEECVREKHAGLFYCSS